MYPKKDGRGSITVIDMLMNIHTHILTFTNSQLSAACTRGPVHTSMRGNHVYTWRTSGIECIQYDVAPLTKLRDEFSSPPRDITSLRLTTHYLLNSHC